MKRFFLFTLKIYRTVFGQGLGELFCFPFFIFNLLCIEKWKGTVLLFGEGGCLYCLLKDKSDENRFYLGLLFT